MPGSRRKNRSKANPKGGHKFDTGIPPPILMGGGSFEPPDTGASHDDLPSASISTMHPPSEVKHKASGETIAEDIPPLVTPLVASSVDSSEGISLSTVEDITTKIPPLVFPHDFPA